MTDAPTIDDERAARLARLRERRGQDAPAEAPTDELVPPSPIPADPDRAERLERLRERRTASGVAGAAGEVTAELPVAPAPAGGRRRSPATNAKIITVGASATAMFGMIAGYGIADGMTAETSAPPPTDVATAAPAAPTAAEIPPASSTTTPTPAPTQPQVIVVVVDGATGETLSTSQGTGDLAVDLAAVGVAPGGSAEASAPAPVQVAAPAAVDLAVPAPPPPPPTRQAAPAPQPQATSSGS